MSTKDASPDKSIEVTPESVNYFRKASDFGFDLIDARERRLSLAAPQPFPMRLVLSIGVMYLALALLSFLVQSGAWTTLWVAIILLLSAPVPAVMLFVYSNPITSTLEGVLARSL